MNSSEHGMLIYDGDLEIDTQNVKIRNFRNLLGNTEDLDRIS